MSLKYPTTGRAVLVAAWRPVSRTHETGDVFEVHGGRLEEGMWIMMRREWTLPFQRYKTTVLLNWWALVGSPLSAMLNLFSLGPIQCFHCFYFPMFFSSTSSYNPFEAPSGQLITKERPPICLLSCMCIGQVRLCFRGFSSGFEQPHHLCPLTHMSACQAAE